MDDQYQPVAMAQTGRTEAFSDGVLAIAITSARARPAGAGARRAGGAARRRAGHEWPTYAAYVTSFLVIGIIWVNHHAVFELLGAIDRVALFLNLLLLMAVAAIPFATSLFAEYLTAGNGNARTRRPGLLRVFLAMSFGFAALYSYVGIHPALLAPGSTRARYARRSSGSARVGLGLYVADDGDRAVQRAGQPGRTRRHRALLLLPADPPRSPAS